MFRSCSKHVFAILMKAVILQGELLCPVSAGSKWFSGVPGCRLGVWGGRCLSPELLLAVSPLLSAAQQAHPNSQSLCLPGKQRAGHTAYTASWFVLGELKSGKLDWDAQISTSLGKWGFVSEHSFSWVFSQHHAASMSFPLLGPLPAPALRAGEEGRKLKFCSSPSVVLLFLQSMALPSLGHPWLPHTTAPRAFAWCRGQGRRKMSLREWRGMADGLIYLPAALITLNT